MLQDKIRNLVERAIAEEGEGAVQVAVFQRGEPVVDVTVAPESVPLTDKSLIAFFSTGKGLAATAVHRLVERGVLSWDAPLAEYWPEFAANGKSGILLRHAMNHTAGLPMMPESPVPVGDWQGMCDYLSAATPVHAPGAHRYYHAITYAWLLGETASRADGRPFSQILRDEVIDPLGLENLFIGVPADRLADCIDTDTLPEPPAATTPEPAPAPDPIAARAIPEWVKPLEDWINRSDVRSACIPASNGYGTARDVARHYAALLGEGVDGVKLLSDETLAVATRWDPATDGVIPGNGCWGLGYALQGPDEQPGVRFGHGGYGGSTSFADRRYGLAVSVLKSRLGGDLSARIVQVIDAHMQ
ncbi:MAG: serine hydrolase domain-containing protein [Verrucomicrobiota bacterium JB024]|nr:serine hydrolase domain-containing protein [Verrucomicrobiota bacterium JB024]